MKCKHENQTRFSTRWASGTNCADCGARLETNRNQEEIERATNGSMRKQLSKGNQERAKEKDSDDSIYDPVTWVKAIEEESDSDEPDPNDIAF